MPNSLVPLDFANSGYSVAFWIKGSADLEADAYILGQYEAKQNQRSWAVLQRANLFEAMFFISPDGTYNTSTILRHLTAQWPEQPIFNGSWRHLAFVFNPANEAQPLSIFLDGRCLQAGTGLHYFNHHPISRLFAPQVSVRVGARLGAKNAFIGKIDELAIWHQALTANQIAWLASHPVTDLVN